MTTIPELDLDRFPYETRRALDAACVLVDNLDPGLSVRPEPGVLVVLDRHGSDLATIPLYRLEAIDRRRLAQYAEAAMSSLPVDLSDQLGAEIRDGRVEIIDDPSSEWVAIDVGDHRLLAVHRGNLCPSWPPPADDTDDPDDGTDHHGPTRSW